MKSYMQYDRTMDSYRVTLTLEHAMKAQRYSSTLSLTLTLII